VWLQDGGTKIDDVDSPQSGFLNDEKRRRKERIEADKTPYKVPPFEGHMMQDS